MARALTAAHAASVLHRDVKPGNVLLTVSGMVKLFDFGLAGEPLGQSTDAEAVHVVGTPEYMAPEQARGHADARSDIYSLGAVMYELITGYQPHVAGSLVELLDLKARASVIPASLRRPEAGVSKALDALLLKMLSADPEQRPQSAAALCQELERLRDAPLVAERAAPPRRRRLARGLVAVMSLVVLGIGGAALAKTEAGLKASASVKGALAEVVRLRAQAVAQREASVTPSLPKVERAVPQAPPAVAARAREPPPVVAPDGATAAGVLDADLEVAAEPAATEPAATVEAAPSDDGEVEDLAASPENPMLVRAEELWRKGSKLRALALLRRAARKAPDDAVVHRALAARAAETGAWGEAVKAARRSVELAPSSEGRLELARLERATGNRGRALALIQGVIRDEPESTEAKALLGELRGVKLALSQ